MGVKSFSKLAVIVFFLAYFLTGVFVYRDYGVPWDEKIQQEYGVEVFNHVFLRDKKPLDKIDKFYGPVFEVFLVGAQKIFNLSDSREIYFSRHFLTFMTQYAGVLFFFLLLRKRFGTWLSLLGSAVLVLTPRLFAHSFYNSKDMVFLSFFIINVYFVLQFLDKRSYFSAFILAFTSAVLIDTRILGVLIPFFVALFISSGVLLPYTLSFLRKRESRSRVKPGMTIIDSGLSLSLLKQELKPLVVYVLVTAIFTVLFWPTLWENPVGNFIKAFKYYPQPTEMLFYGKKIESVNLPFYYAPGWMLVTIPPAYIFVFCLGLFYFVYKRSSLRKEDMLILLWFFVPLLSVILLKSVLYDEWRQLFFIYPAFVYILTFAVNASGFFLKRALILAVLVNALLALGFMYRNHPFENMYFNVFAGEKSTIGQRFDLDYWGLSYRKGLEYIVRTDDRDKIKVKVANYPGKNNTLILPEPDRKRLDVSQKTKEPDYYVTNFRGEVVVPESFEEVHSVWADGVKILNVYKKGTP
ncbi:hypothetical protein A2716_05195 [candidate division WWE3 bacterium RIFCSPHIGHO2_01_FULL_40_23]|uniref:Glycosyltransferase RgtA/B/C/D-like domain-containing protein n=1 Tax=candidate division WWE3 bacterium RIFCSPLOWO2_01_FULL_41_18 TaxID=1802625 RepID=A0A1F4VDB4_UNCKA|nr:MAG: hypothetical protein A2716_05195 [candidate division WWE3 bacterium RIFCSPHIGHO2_01_FULL_40_23]OGC55266.1 MAG: hypothetical protein A3A78_04805 [candidate division WWE3 bacterium RIFCSPLOWO2_01_FULL_41_18]